MNSIDQSLELDAMLEKEMQDLRSEDMTLGHREMLRRVQIRERIEEIGRQRFEMFLERRKLYD